MFRAAAQAPEPPFVVLFVYGPGGVGKTSLLGEFARLAHEVGVPAIRLDGRSLEPSPNGFLLALERALGGESGGTALAALADRPRCVLLLDTFETVESLDPWLRDVLLPQLPDHHLVVIAGRNPPAAAWRTDPGWQDLVRVLPLRNLRPEESRGYLRARGVPEARHQDVLGFTHGHPLALSLVGDALAQGDEQATVAPVSEPDVVRVLLERFVEHVPSPDHRLALEACAHVRVLTEPILAAALARDEAGEIFAWMRGLSFIEQGPEGLFPHDLAREVLDADLRWRNREEYRRLHHRVRGELVRRLQAHRGRDRQRAMFDLLFMHRANPLMRAFHEWSSLGSVYLEPASPHDHPAILETTAHHEGEASARIAAHWLRRQPDAFTVFRRPGQELLGFCANLALGEPDPADLAADPAIEPAWSFARRAGAGRAGELMIHHRFFMARQGYQTDALAHNMVATNCVSTWLSTPDLARSFITVASGDEWAALFAYLDIHRAPEADFEVGGHRYAIFTHDWRARPVIAWLELMGERELAEEEDLAPIAATPPSPLIVLSRPQFDDAVRHGLRNISRLDQLAGNPLLRSRLVVDRAGTASPAGALQALLHEAAACLSVDPRDAKLYRAIRRTYLEPAATQELAAEALGLPFNTYRYQLNAAIKRIADHLWRRELHGLEG